MEVTVLIKCRSNLCLKNFHSEMKVRQQAEPGSKASLLLPLCNKKLEAEGRAMQTSEASLPYQGKCKRGTEAVGRGAHHASIANNGVGTRSVQGYPLVHIYKAEWSGHSLTDSLTQ